MPEQKTPAAQREIGFAIVGCGVIGPWHAGAIARVAGARLVACADNNKERAQELARGYGDLLKKLDITKEGGNVVPAVYTNYKTMLKRDDIDVICVCVPSGDHAKVGIEAAQAGKHVISEKPLDVTLAKMDAFIQATQNNHVQLAAIFQRRFDPNAMRIKQAIEAGKFGKILQADCTVKWYRAQKYYDSGEWRGTWELDGGGCLMNQGVHGVDLLQWFAGPIAWVQSWCATTARQRIQVETQAIAIVGFKSGAHGVIQGSTVCWPGEPVINQVFGTKGTASLQDSRLTSWKFMKETAADKNMLNEANNPMTRASGTDPLAALGQPGDTHYPQIKDMVEAVRTGRAPACTGQDARHAVEVILAIYESARRGGERIKLPLKADSPATGFPKA
ncbi:MAG: Gfo/Idh/MocA family oxidoreductase [Abitibacteriaceae bacterium]|nr:Gfo/Idh/MocA family oxidoreductase [Abditibacteriaceae bacterium]